MNFTNRIKKIFDFGALDEVTTMPFTSSGGDRSIEGQQEVTIFKYNPTRTQLDQLSNDDHIFATLDICSTVASNSYKGVEIIPDETIKDDENEKKLKMEAKKLLDDADIRDYFYSTINSLLIYGDTFDEVNFNEGKLILQSLPIEEITITENEKQDPRKVIKHPNFFILNERGSLNPTPINNSTIKEIKYKKEEIIHNSFNNRKCWFTDKLNRKTYGVYSKSPLSVLYQEVIRKNQVLYYQLEGWKRTMKQKVITVDTTKMEEIPVVADTIEEEFEKKKAKIESHLNHIRNQANSSRSDNVIVNTSTVKQDIQGDDIGQADNEIIKGINEFLSSVTGVNSDYLGGSSNGYRSSSTTFVITQNRIERISLKIARNLEYHLKRYFLGKDYSDELVDRLRIKISSTLPQVDLETSKTATLMASIDETFTKNEIRSRMGYPELGVEGEVFIKANTNLKEIMDEEGDDGGSKSESKVMQDITKDKQKNV